MSLIARVLAQFPPRKTIGIGVHDTEPTAPVAPVDALDVLVNDPLQNPRGLSREEYAATLRAHDLAMQRLEWAEKSYVPPHVEARQAGEALRRAMTPPALTRDEMVAQFEAQMATEAYRRR